MRTRPKSPLLVAALLSLAKASLLHCTCGTLLAESVSRSEAQTAGEKRLLDWDLNKSYDLSRSRTNPKGQAPSRAFATQSFRPGAFQTKAFSAEAFTSPEFLTPEGRTLAKPFAAKQPFTLPSPTFGKAFLPGSTPSAPPKAVPTSPTSAPSAPKKFAGADRPFQGPEAARKDQKYLPGNPPAGGVVEGRKLSMDEVREILNKSK
jgi:hypothetical protein